MPNGNNEYGNNSPNDAGDVFNNQRKSQQSQKTLSGNGTNDKDSISVMVGKRNPNGTNTTSNNTIANNKLQKNISQHQFGSHGAQHIVSQKTGTTKLQKVGINKQLQKAGSKNYNNDSSLRQTQKSQFNMGSQNSKLNSYYNTKSSFGIRNSSKNNAK